MALREAWLRWRNRILTDPKFIAFAQRFPPTRPIARSKSGELFNILAGFSHSQVLYACVSLGVFQHVAQRPSAIQDLAAHAGLTVAKTNTLLRAAIALRLLDWSGQNVTLGPHGAALMAQPWILKFIEHHRHFYRDLEDPVAMLKGKPTEGGLRDYWNYASTTKNRAEYSALMAASQTAVAEQILLAYDFRTYQSVLDVGGGTGAFVTALLDRLPHTRCAVFDLPDVVKLIDNQRIHTCAGDFRRDPLPQGADLITLIRVLHDHDDDAVLALLKNVRSSCRPETILLVAEPFAGNRATATVTDAYFNMYFAAMGQGRTRTPKEISSLAAEAGFHNPRLWSTQMPIISGVMTFSPLVKED